MKKIQERALRIIYKDYEISYEDLLPAAEAPTMLTRRLRVILLEVFKSINMFNSDCLNDMFEIKDGNYSFRNTRELLQPKKKKQPHLGKKYCLSRCQIMEWQWV